MPITASCDRLRAFALVNCVADCVWLTVPQPTEWQRIGNQIDAATIFAGGTS